MKAHLPALFMSALLFLGFTLGVAANLHDNADGPSSSATRSNDFGGTRGQRWVGRFAQATTMVTSSVVYETPTPSFTTITSCARANNWMRSSCFVFTETVTPTYTPVSSTSTGTGLRHSMEEVLAARDADAERARVVAMAAAPVVERAPATASDLTGLLCCFDKRQGEYLCPCPYAPNKDEAVTRGPDGIATAAVTATDVAEVGMEANVEYCTCYTCHNRGGCRYLPCSCKKSGAKISYGGETEQETA